jgi:hypothetical protein
MQYRSLARVCGVAALFGISGCAALFVPESNDPLVKLEQAHDLDYHRNRPLTADRLIHQAMAICEERKDDNCLGLTLMRYGQFLVSPGFEDEHWAAPYTQGAERFLDSTVTLENRKLKAIEYITRARELFLKEKVYSNVLNADLKLSDTYIYLADKPNACIWITKSHLDFEAAIALDPNLSMHLDTTKWPTWPDFVAWRKKDLGCLE